MAAPMAAVSMGSTLLGGITSAFGASAQAQSQAAMYNYQSQVAETNRQIAEQNKNYAIAAGEVSAQEAGMKARFQRGMTIAQQGAGGLAVGSGSNARVVESELEIGQQDQALIRSNAARTAYGYEVEATADTAQSQLDQMAAASAKKAGTINVFGSLLGAAGSVSSKWLQADQAGVFK